VSSLSDRLKAKFEFVERGPEDMHDYQNFAVDFLWKNPFSALFIDTGLGKTIIILTLLVRLWLKGKLRKALIVAPVRVAAQTWPNEIMAWQHTAFFNFSVIRAEDDDEEVISAGRNASQALKVDPGALARVEGLIAALVDLGGEEQASRSYARRQLSKWAAQAAGLARTAMKEELRQKRRRSTATIHLINREHLEWLVDQHSEMREVKINGKRKRKRVVVDWPYNVVILDESSSYKDASTDRFKAMAAIRVQAGINRLHQLTATPAAEGYMGLFAQIYLLDLGKRLGVYITHFREKFFNHNAYAHTYKLKHGADKEIGDIIADLCLVMKAEDYLDDTPPLFLDRMINMAPHELEQYQKFERDFILTLDDGEKIEAETAAALSGKLLQLSSGAVYTKDKQVRVVHEHKIEDLRQLREELQGEPLMVAYWYKSSLARLRKAFPDAWVMDAAGKVAGRRGPWNTGKIPMLLVHPASIGHGLNMQYGPGHDLYMFDQCWSYELFYQLYRRLARQGQKLRVRVHLPQMRGTNDSLVVERLKVKEDAQEALFKRIRAMRRRLQELRLAA